MRMKTWILTIVALLTSVVTVAQRREGTCTVQPKVGLNVSTLSDAQKTIGDACFGMEAEYMITDMLVSTSGYTTKATSVNGITYASKTGTSNFPDEILEQYHLGYNAVNDLWVAGYSRDFAVAVWYGYDQISSEYYNKMSSGGNINLYKEIIKGVYTGTENFTKPSSVVSVTVEKHSPGNGQLPSQYTPSGYTTTELYKAGTEPTTVSERFQQLPNVTNLKSSLNGNKITLSWNGIETPNALNRDYLRNQYSQMCKNVEACVNIIIGEDSSMLGNLVYNIYQKNSDGSLKYVDSTTNTSFEKNAPQNAGNKVTYKRLPLTLVGQLRIAFNSE